MRSRTVTSSVAGVLDAALPYAVAKAAIEGLTRAAAVDHGSDGIRVNAVALVGCQNSELAR